VKRLIVVALAALTLAAPAFASEQHPTQSELEEALICPTCHVPLDESDSPIAQQLKGIIRADIAKGWTRSRIMSSFVQQFGPGILSEPQTHGFDLVAWVLPIGGIIAGAVGLAGGAWYWSRNRLGPGSEEAGDAAALDPELELRLDEELARFDG
jgi:cytochrome c-type biogenesis protein CcmH